jgi:hypothetical protein
MRVCDLGPDELDLLRRVLSAADEGFDPLERKPTGLDAQRWAFDRLRFPSCAVPLARVVDNEKGRPRKERPKFNQERSQTQKQVTGAPRLLRCGDHGRLVERGDHG